MSDISNQEDVATSPAQVEEDIELELPGGVILEVPAGASPEAIRNAVQAYRQSPDFDRTIDKSRGAPANVRMLVGGSPQNDRLANIKRFYPDAFAYGEDNFVFTDPETMRPTLYNPEGFDVGDIASVGREASQAVGGTLGAMFGATGGFVVGLPTGPGAAATTLEGGIIGAGMGTMLGGQLFDLTANLIAGRIDTRSITRRTLEAGSDFAAGAAGQRIGELAPIFIKRTLGGVKNQAARLVEAFQRLGVEPPAAAVTGSRTIGGVQKALEVTPSSAGVMQKQAERVIQQTSRAANTLAAKFGAPQTEAGAGEAIKRAAVAAAERFGFKQEAVYNEAFDLVGDATRVAVPAARNLRQAMTEELARAPNTLDRVLAPAINMLKSIEDDAVEGIEFATLRQIRTNIGRDLANPQLLGSSGAQNEGLKRIYAALTEDMSNAAKAAGPEAAKKLAVADRFTRIFMNTAGKTLEKINKFEADEKAFKYVSRLTVDGSRQLARLRRHFTPDEWDTVAGTVLQRMGLARPGGQTAAGDAFSVNTFLTNWSRMTPEAKELMFGGARYKNLAPALDDLVDVVSSLKGIEKLTNTSNTAQNLIAFSMIQTIGTTLGAFAAGGPGAVVSGTATLAGQTVAPWAAAKLITSPAFVRWLSTPVTRANGVSAHLGRLAAIAAEDPTLREPIDQLVNALRSAPSGSRSGQRKSKADSKSTP